MPGAWERPAPGIAGAVMIACAVTGAAPAAGQAPLSVRIETPHAGVVPGPTVWLEARVSSPRVRSASLVVNGATYEVPVEQGRVRQRLVAVPGNNRVGVVVRDGARIARDSLTFRYDGEPLEMVIVLGWRSAGEIVDLWVREPDGETCKWDHRRTTSGGHLLDFSENAIGFGSQAYVLPRVQAGRFRVKVHYWGGYAHDDDRSWYAYDDLIRRHDALERRALAAAADERDDLGRQLARTRARLDAWSAPAGPQTPVHAEVVLFPGTHQERRYRFDVLVQRTGHLVTLGEIEIDDAMIAAARREAP